MTAPLDLGPMPADREFRTVDEIVTRAPIDAIYAIAADVEAWPAHLSHYRYVRFLDRRGHGAGTVEMSANRPFGPIDWPTWWVSLMTVTPVGSEREPNIRFRHIRGITTGMDVEWTFRATAAGTLVRIVHVWNGPGWPLIGDIAASGVIGPVFVHGIASRTLAGLAHAAERSMIDAARS